METAKITLKLVRSFGVGIDILSPKWNGFCVEIQVGCFILLLWSRGKLWFKFSNYFKG